MNTLTLNDYEKIFVSLHEATDDAIIARDFFSSFYSYQIYIDMRTREGKLADDDKWFSSYLISKLGALANLVYLQPADDNSNEQMVNTQITDWKDNVLPELYNVLLATARLAATFGDKDATYLYDNKHTIDLLLRGHQSFIETILYGITQAFGLFHEIILHKDIRVSFEPRPHVKVSGIHTDYIIEYRIVVSNGVSILLTVCDGEENLISEMSNEYTVNDFKKFLPELVLDIIRDEVQFTSEYKEFIHE